MKELEIDEAAQDWLPTINGWIKLVRSVQLRQLWARGHGAWTLLSIVAVRAWRGPEKSPFGHMPGEAFVGDWGACGFTEKSYRIAKKQLEEMGLCSFRATNKGTIAKLLSADIYDINSDFIVTDRAAKGEQGASEGRSKGEQGASEGRTRGEPGASEGHLTRSVRREISEEGKKQRNKKENNSASGAAGELAPSAGDTEVATPPGAEPETEPGAEPETEPEVADEIPGAEPATPTQKAVELSREFPHFLKAVCGYQQLPVFTRSTLQEAIEFFERNPGLEYYDVALACAKGLKFARENPAPEEGPDPYFICRRFAGRPNKLFDRTAEGDLYLARLMNEVKYDTVRGEHIDVAQAFFNAEIQRIIDLKKASRQGAAARKPVAAGN